VLSDQFEHDPARGSFPGEQIPAHEPLSHLELVGNADLYLIAPASANTIAKLAHGLANDLLSSAALAADCPVLVAPAMNNRMYEHPATQANLQTLTARGVHVIAPDSGRLASHGEWGSGRLAEPRRLLSSCEEILAGAQSAPGGEWQGLRVLISAGGTHEPIDSVRFIANSSSGRMGVALAQAAVARGAKVTLVAANIDLEIPPQVSVHRVSSAADLQRACEELFPSADVLLMAAAVADFRPVTVAAQKIKKSEHGRLELELEPTTDVLSLLSQGRRPGQTLVGFAAEHGADAIAYGREKLLAKGLDAVVVNDISRADIGFQSTHNEVSILTASGEEHIARAPKQQIAQAILDTVKRLRQPQ
jgi:phosphopantothenoylcysteine decarboxylase/phosphopantothenate--cysteine ligase